MDQVSDIEEPEGFDAFEYSLGDKMRGERATMGKTLSDIEDDLKLREEILLGIENCDLTAFASPSFVAGYVRSYASHLGLDPNECFDQFCEESGFVGLKFQIQTGKEQKTSFKMKQNTHLDDAILTPRVRAMSAQGGFGSQFSVSGMISLGVVCLLIAGLSWGGLTVLKEVQRVQFSPVNETPEVLPHIAALSIGDEPVENAIPLSVEQYAELKDRKLQELYRPTELAIPVLTPRDGAIASIDPESFGVFATKVNTEITDEIALLEQPIVTEMGPPAIDIVALKPAWVRVFLENGDILFEKILDSGQRYRLPEGASDVLMRAGNSGSVYVMIGDKTFGPVGKGTGVARKVVLAPDVVAQTYETVEALFDLPLQEPINKVAASTAE